MKAPEKAFLIPGDPIEDLMHHLDHGWVYSSPTAFGMARIVDADWEQEDLKCPEVYVDPSDDLTSEKLCWYFTRIAGDMAEVFSKLPFPLPYVGWHRHKVHETPRIYEYDHLHRKLEHSPQCGFHAIVRRREGTQKSSPTAGRPTGPSTGQ